jgi:hypothetical protein
VGRLVVPWALVALFGASAILAPSSPLYWTAFVAQLGFYGLAMLGGWLDAHHQPDPVRFVERRSRPRPSAQGTYEPLRKEVRS